MTEINPSEEATPPISNPPSSTPPSGSKQFSDLMPNGDPKGTKYSNNLEKFLGKKNYKKFETQFEQSVSQQCSKERKKQKEASERLHRAQTGGDMWDD